LLKGDYKQGWELYEWRWKRDTFTSPDRGFKQPLWLGEEPLKGKTILLHTEQGFGDMIQFGRYAKEVSALGARVVLEIPKPLYSLFQTLEGVDELVVKGEKLPEFDYQCPLLSLPLAFKTDLSNIPSPGPYLKSDPKKVKQWQKKLGEKKKPRIGVVWSSVSSFKDDAKRSMRLEEFIQCIPLDEYEVVCLQKEIKAEDKAYFDSLKGKISFYGPELKDFADTAALASCMDLVVSTCTSVPHMTAALGIPTWVLLSYVPDWRWMLEREDSPWYASVRLFRQDLERNWQLVLCLIKQELKRH
jgi:hypothetical protein